ncbi:hypothetical protein BXZ70DRAFT_306155 [Cristinia sonorae]|uniref:Uncharacterized protein n=1 Tax=Cristinia sonorae TaxID=1940300 RepID=A0A8K0XNK8_9AGAR|nr:hypothetical protein BXZ70DRAFT_306155 [Cristinia sonorae]
MALLRSKHDWNFEDQQNHKSRQNKIQALHGQAGLRDDHDRRWQRVKDYWDLSNVTWAITDSQLNFLVEEMEKEQRSLSHQRHQSSSQVAVSSAPQKQPAHTRTLSSAAHTSTSSTAPSAYRQGGALQEQQSRAFEERSGSASRPERRASEDDSVFTVTQQLKPTFPSNIVRTPQHYSSASAAAAAHSSSAQPSTPSNGRISHERSQPSPRPHGPIYGPPTPRVPVSSTRNNSDPTVQYGTSTTRGPTTPSRSSSDPSAIETPSRQSASSSTYSTPTRGAAGPSPLAYLPTFSEEPATGLLSPLVSVATPPADRSGNHERSGSRSGRELSRSQTVPSFSAASTSVFASVPEERSPPTSSRTPRPSPHAPPSSYPSHYRDDASTPTPSSRRSPGDARTIGRAQTMPNIDPYQPASQSSSRITSPSASPRDYPGSRSPSRQSPSRSRKPSRSPLRNPLPAPPNPSSYSSTAWPSTEKAMSALALNGSSRSYSQSESHSHDHPREYQDQHPRETPSHTSRPSPTKYPVQSPPTGYNSRAPVASTVSSASSAARAIALARKESSDREKEQREREQRERERERERDRMPTRRGFWNKRGDYLMLLDHVKGGSDRFIVYAPSHLANPPELQDYPSPTVGFMNHHGKFVKYDPTIPELPQSLPVHGQPPVQPYESFVRYTHEPHDNY